MFSVLRFRTPTRALRERCLVTATLLTTFTLLSAPVSAQNNATSNAETRQPLSLGAVYLLVDARGPRLLAAQALARAAAARVAGTTRPPDPQLQLGFMNRSLPGLGPDPVLGMTQLQLMQMVPSPGKLSAAGAAATARTAAANARARDVAWSSRVAAAMAFYDRYESAARVSVARDTRRLLEDAADIAGAMYRVGEGRQADVLRARVELARMDEDIVRMEAMQAGALARLAAAADTADSVLAGTPLLPRFPDTIPSLDTLVRMAYGSRAMLVAGAEDIRAAQASSTLARRELWPDLQVGVQYGQRRMDGETDRMGSLMLGASLPVFARSRQLRMRDETAAMQQMAEAELTAMRADTRARLGEVLADLASARRLRALYRSTVLPQAEATTTSSLASYRTGTVDFMTVIENRMSVNRYRQELAALDAAEGRAWAELEMLVGRVLVTTTGATR